MRELADGRVILTAPRDKRVAVADFRSGTLTTVGREGHGPKEYDMISHVLPFAGDSTVMISIMGQRWLTFDGARITGKLPENAPYVVEANKWKIRGIDRTGRILLDQELVSVRGDAKENRKAPDSATIAVLSRSPFRVDSIGKIRGLQRDFTVRSLPNTDAKVVSLGVIPLQVAEQVVMAPDGWVAVVRLDPYRVDWRSPDGRWVRGKPIPTPTIKVTRAEKLAYAEREAVRTGRPAPNIDRIGPWPETFPAVDGEFEHYPVLASPDGRLLVRKSKTIGNTSTRYDVIDRAGALVGELTLPDTDYILGFGVASAYVAAQDEDGMIRLRRHPWPPR
jgi:hypothetical protein